MKILQLVPELNVGGVERGTVDLARVLIVRGHEAHVISAGGTLVKELEKSGAFHTTLPIHKKSIGSLKLVKKLVDYIENHGIDIVHARSRVPAWIGYLATRYTDASFLTTCHGYYSTHFLSRVMGWGTRVIAVSNVIGRHMMDDFGVEENRIRLIPRGVDLNQFDYAPLKDRLPKKGEPLRIINVGRITPLKGHLDFIRAVHWAKQQGNPVKAWIVGSAPSSKKQYFEEVEDLVKKLGLENEVKFLGTRYDIPELLKKAHLLVLSTTTPEAFGRVVTEAGASGTAVISTQVGGVVDIVRDGKEGRLVPPHDPQAMGEAICEVIHNQEDTVKFSESLREQVQTNFNLNQMYEKTLEVYQETYEEKRILVIKLSALGDLILISPSLRLLRKSFPKATITLLVDERFYEVALQLPYVDEVIVTHRKKQKQKIRRFFKLLGKLRTKRFDLSIDFQNIPKTHLLAAWGGIPKRYGYRRGTCGWLLTSGQDYFKESISPVRHQFRLLNRLGVGMGFVDESLELKASETARAQVDELLEGVMKKSWEGELSIGFALSASQKWVSKNWDLSSFQQLAKMILDQYPAKIFLIGTSGEEKKGREFEAGFEKGQIVNLAGKTSLGNLMEVIRRLDLLIGADSAPLHIAGAYQVPLIGLFGPTDHRRHEPPGEKKKIVQKKVPCGPCYEKRCPIGTHDCMKLITPEEVFQEARVFLSEPTLVKQKAVHS